ncbi:hypothetical protein [Cohnella thermotolerans]|uniref:hypothetical protein n=1 Tax=Cohnella thermotolerans TaxID=329858 RepID=UPI000418FF82|nr:hypothetical protein [Cohnella thermotolerans]
MERKRAIEMHLPDGKLPGYYAQIVKGIAERTELFDRIKELLVLNSPEDAAPVLELLRHYKTEAEELELVLLPEEGVEREALYEDYVIESVGGRVYTVWSDTAYFRITAEEPEAEPAPALLQLQENMIASVREDGFVWHAVDRKEEEWVERVARAYRCGVVWLR